LKYISYILIIYQPHRLLESFNLINLLETLEITIILFSLLLTKRGDHAPFGAHSSCPSVRKVSLGWRRVPCLERGASGIDVSGAAAGPGALLWLPESPLSRAEANTSNQTHKSPPAPRAISAVRHTTEQSKCKQRPAAGRSRRRAWPSQQHHPDRRRQAGHPASGCLCSAARRMPPRSARTPRTPRKRPRSRTSTTSRRCLARKYHTARTLRTPSVSTSGRECHWRTAAHSWDTRTPDLNSSERAIFLRLGQRFLCLL
jgi:hypothetical protein